MSQCHSHNDHCHTSSGKRSIDWIYWGSLALVGVGYFFYLIETQISFLPPLGYHFSHSVFELMNTMAWGLALGIFFIGLLGFIPREVVISVVGSPKSKMGILRATAAGVFLDLCNHGILMIGMKLYQKGASLAQVMAFLIASPWNSYSLTLILISLIGFPLTLSFVLLSAVVAIITGLLIRALVLYRVLPDNPNSVQVKGKVKIGASLAKAFEGKFQDPKFYVTLIRNGVIEGQMVLKWILFGTVLTAGIRLFMTTNQYQEYLGPTLAGMGMTLFVATILEVCSEGSSPLAAELVTKANAPGNAFAFLMTGASTDYTELLAIRETTGSWKIALFLPLLTVPQVFAIGMILNGYSFF